MKKENGMTATPVEPIVSPFYDRDGITIYNADCRQVLPLLGKFDLLLTDPPYGVGVSQRGKVGSSKCGQVKQYAKEDWDAVQPAETRAEPDCEAGEVVSH